MKRLQRQDYDYLSASFGHACYRADLAVWWNKHRRPAEPPIPIPEPELEPSAFQQSREHFDSQVRAFPNLLERYVIALADVNTEDEQQEIMWRGLRETFRQRFPQKGQPPTAADLRARYGTRTDEP